MRVSSRVGFVLLYGALLIWQVDRWCFTPHGVATTWWSAADGQPASAVVEGGLVQTFRMAAEGLDGVWLRPIVERRSPPRGHLVVDLLVHADGGRSSIERVEIPAVDVAPGRSLHVPFRPQPHARDRELAIAIRHVDAGDGPGIAFATTRADTLRGESFRVGDVERWGDLFFEATARRATLPYWLPEILAPWPAWVRAWPTIVTALVLFNLALAWACAAAAGLWVRPGTSEAPALPPTRAFDAGRTARGAVVCAALLGGIAVARRGGPPPGQFDLIEALPDARIESTWPTIHTGVTLATLDVDGRPTRSLVALPTSRIAWDVHVPPDARLRVGAGQRPDMFYYESDGIQMRVAVEHDASRVVVADLTLFPFGVEAHRRVVPVEVSLRPWAGQRVRLVFETTPERWGNAVNDVPVWTAPRLEWGPPPRS